MKFAASFLALISLLVTAQATNDNVQHRNLQFAGRIQSLVLIDSISDNPLMELRNDTIVVVRSIPGMTTPSFNINATVSGSVVSVKYGYSNLTVRNANLPMLSFCGNADKDFFKCPRLGYGRHTITATPYTVRNAQGSRGPSVTVTFTIVDRIVAPTKAPVAKAVTKAPVKAATKAPVKAATKAPVKAATKAPVKAVTQAPVVPTLAPVVPTQAPVIPPTLAPVAPVAMPVAPFTGITTLQLIYTGRVPHASVVDLPVGQTTVVNLGPLGLPSTARFNINAVRNGNTVNSVLFVNNGKKESSLPWAYCGNDQETYRDCPDLVAGATVNLTVIPYPERGQVGTPLPLIWAAVHILDGTMAPTISKAPTRAPVTRAPTPAPVPTAPLAPPPTQPQTCTTPKLVGTWTSRTSHFPVAEAQGAMMGTHMVIVGGFLAGYDNVTTQTLSFDTSNPSAVWVRQDDYPFAQGVTHGAFVVVGTKFYMCGGYAGGGIGMHTDVCMVYDHSKPKGVGQQWSLFTPLPGGGRAGGGMVYDSTLNALIFSAGATRPIPQKRTALDHANTWLYSLSNPSAVWVPKAPMPFFANHMSSVTARDASGKERHYFTGGQKGEDEHDGNQAEHFEYDALNDQWFARKFMTIPRSHAASSTRAIGCGFIMVAGCTNGGLKIADISYYDTTSDTWTKIGDLSNNINTPVCDISNGVLYCDTGWDSGKFSKKIGIAL